VGEVSLRDRFPRLFDLSLFKDLSVFDMCQLGWGVEGQAWSWRRRLRAWEEEAVGELTLLLQNVSLQVDSTDTWCWKLETSHIFSVRSAYTALTSESIASPMAAVTTPCHAQAPLKVVLFAWRMFRERLPTKDNLLHRGVITFDYRLCLAGCNSVETTIHLFLHCPTFGSVWQYLLRWLGFSTALPLGVIDHFNQFSSDNGTVKGRRAILQVICLATTWEIWKERNNRLFNGKQTSILQVVDKIKSLAFMWLKEKHPTLPFNLHAWWLSPFTILGIG